MSAADGSCGLDEAEEMALLVGAADRIETLEAKADLLTAALDKMERSRDELLATIKDVAGWVGGMCAGQADDDYHARLLAVIAKAEAN